MGRGENAAALRAPSRHFESGELACKDKLLVVIDGSVYDLSSWRDKHPGGSDVIDSMRGKDCTDVFTVFHPSSVWKQLPAFKKGIVIRDKSATSVAFQKLHKKLQDQGLFDTDYMWFVTKFATVFCMLFVAIFLTVTAKHSMCQTVIAALMFGLFLQQAAFLGHDTGHNAITHNRRLDCMIGVVIGPLLTGLSVVWWKKNHNVHHVVTNSVDYDPDIQHLPVFAVSTRFFKSVWSKYYRKLFPFDSVSRTLVQYQHILYMPIMLFARWNLYRLSWATLLSDRHRGYLFRRVELAAMCLYYVWGTLLVSTLPTSTARCVFVLLSHALAGVLHHQICLSHFAMDTYEGNVWKQGNDDFFMQQLATTQDIDTAWWNDWFHGGLQWQVEHHLFPRMPRHNLCKIKGVVQSFCREHGIPYHSQPFFQASFHLLKHMRTVASKVDSAPRLSESILAQMARAEG